MAAPKKCRSGWETWESGGLNSDEFCDLGSCLDKDIANAKRAVKLNPRLMKWNRNKMRRTFFWAHAIRGVPEWSRRRHYNLPCGQSCKCCRSKNPEDWFWSGCWICNALRQPYTQRLSWHDGWALRRRPKQPFALPLSTEPSMSLLAAETPRSP